MATYDDSFSGYHRVMTIDPYRPARTELLGTNAGQASSSDVGKAVKLSGAGTVLCAEGDEIYGIVESISAGTSNGYSVAGVLCSSGNEAYATDTADNCVVGDLVVAGAPVAFGTAVASTGVPVKKAAGTEAGIDRWVVVAKYTTPATGLLIRKL